MDEKIGKQPNLGPVPQSEEAADSVLTFFVPLIRIRKPPGGSTLPKVEVKPYSPEEGTGVADTTEI